MGLTNNMPPFSLSAHHFVQKGERLLFLDHTLMDVLIIQIPFLFILSTLLYCFSSLLLFCFESSFHSFMSLSRHSYHVSNGVFTFSSSSLEFLLFSIFLVFQPFSKVNAPPYIHCTTLSFQIWMHLPYIHLF